MDWNDIDGDVVNVTGKDHLAEMDAHYALVRLIEERIKRARTR